MTNLLRLEVVENNNGLEITNLSKREDLQKMDRKVVSDPVTSK